MLLACAWLHCAASSKHCHRATISPGTTTWRLTPLTPLLTRLPLPPPRFLQEYAKAFLAAGFSENHHVYIASGLLSYNSSKEMLDMLEFLRPFSKTVQYKERYIPPEELHALNPEQQVGRGWSCAARCCVLRICATERT